MQALPYATQLLGRPRDPWLGEHTDDVLRAELGLTDADLTALRASGTIA